MSTGSHPVETARGRSREATASKSTQEVRTMKTIKKIIAVDYTDTSTGESGPTPLQEDVYGYFDTMAEAFAATGGKCHNYNEVEFTPEEWKTVEDDFNAERDFDIQYDAWCAQFEHEFLN
jgi:hypothetical protein